MYAFVQRGHPRSAVSNPEVMSRGQGEPHALTLRPSEAHEDIAMKHELTAERLRELLHYDPDTGLIFWAASRKVAGTKQSGGYVQVEIRGRRYVAHRLAWLWMTGQWPRDQIDHINGIRADNRWSNLREATHAENMQNQRSSRSDSLHSSKIGVGFHRVSGKWRARIGLNGVQRTIGYFDSEEEAHAAYLKAKAEHHPFSTITESEQ